MNRAPRWQDRVIAALTETNAIVFNPRRNIWDNSWEQRVDSEPFRAQVEWELDGLERADLVPMYLAPGTRSPISLLELGLLANSGRLVVCCPEGFWRKGNVEIVCARHGITVVEDLDALIRYIDIWCRSAM